MFLVSKVNVFARLDILSKITFFKKKVKKGPRTRSFRNQEQNNNFIFQKSCRIYILYKKIRYQEMAPSGIYNIYI